MVPVLLSRSCCSSSFDDLLLFTISLHRELFFESLLLALFVDNSGLMIIEVLFEDFSNVYIDLLLRGSRRWTKSTADIVRLGDT